MVEAYNEKYVNYKIQKGMLNLYYSVKFNSDMYTFKKKIQDLPLVVSQEKAEKNAIDFCFKPEYLDAIIKKEINTNKAEASNLNKLVDKEKSKSTIIVDYSNPKLENLL